MDCVSPIGRFTSRHPFGQSCGCGSGHGDAELLMEDTAVYERLEEKAARIEHAFKYAVEKYHVKAQVN